jgi:hypothetical protein
MTESTADVRILPPPEGQDVLTELLETAKGTFVILLVSCAIQANRFSAD